MKQHTSCFPLSSIDWVPLTPHHILAHIEWTVLMQFSQLWRDIIVKWQTCTSFNANREKQTFQCTFNIGHSTSTNYCTGHCSIILYGLNYSGQTTCVVCYLQLNAKQSIFKPYKYNSARIIRRPKFTYRCYIIDTSFSFYMETKITPYLKPLLVNLLLQSFFK